jgi:hypothetical protein
LVQRSLVFVCLEHELVTLLWLDAGNERITAPRQWSGRMDMLDSSVHPPTFKQIATACRDFFGTRN